MIGPSTWEFPLSSGTNVLRSSELCPLNANAFDPEMYHSNILGATRMLFVTLPSKSNEVNFVWADLILLLVFVPLNCFFPGHCRRKWLWKKYHFETHRPTLRSYRGRHTC